MQILQKLVPIALLTFVLSSMLAMGLSLTIGQIITPLRNVRLVVLSMVANFVLTPLAATGLAALLRLDQPFGVGLLLLGTAAGAYYAAAQPHLQPEPHSLCTPSRRHKH